MAGLNAEIFLDDMLANLTEERDEARAWARRMMRERDEALEDARYFRGGLCRAEERERILWDNKESLITCLQEVIDKNWPRNLGALLRLPPHLRDRIHVPGES